MKFLSLPNTRSFGLYLLLIIFCCLPIWCVENYYNQDGSPHLYNAYILLELFKKNPVFTEVYALNPAPLPNLSGHYLLSLLLIFFAPTLVTKIFATLLFAAFVAAVGWLRRQTVGAEDLGLSMLIGAALAFNWMWLFGFYNFIIGAIGFTFTLGLYWRWRENLNLFRALVVSLLVIVVFFSHLISFGMLIGGIILIGICVSSPYLKRTLAWTAVIFLPVLPLLIGFRALSQKGGAMFPVWRNLENPLSVSGWLMQMQAADPFQLLSRKAFPFVADISNLYAVFAPFLWIAAALLLLMAALFLSGRHEIFSRESLPFALITVLSVIFWMFAPDDFGKLHGGFLRERVLLCGLVCFVPLIKTEKVRFLKYAAAACLVFVLVFQTAAVFDYALFAEKIGDEFVSGRSSVTDADSVSAIVFIKEGCRYKPSPLAGMTGFYGIGKNTRILDNYEIGLYQFPVVVKKPEDSQFNFDFREASYFELCYQKEDVAKKLSELDALLEKNNDKISVMLVWGADERLLPILRKWYRDEPFFQNGRVRLFRRR